ncbi:MAG: 23S rRNA (guanosine(2251)-2'-O)-methyltransferase RlmB [Candidatus Thioglobus sp.]|nr:23S rRNA (guanosine(2251)-2'-O)-methyltransferase RlmB [Candidatus Thioglobus sp.]
MSKSIIIFGFHAVQAQLETNPQQILNAFTLQNRNDKRLGEISAGLHQMGIHTQKCDKQQLDKITQNQSHQGIVIEILPAALPNQDGLMEYISKSQRLNLILILDSIQDPRNLGACLRSANAAGVDCVIINKNGSAPVNDLVYKAAAGALNQLKIFAVSNLSRTIKALKEQNIWVVGLDAASEKSIYSTDLTGVIAVVMGAEGGGLRRLTKVMCDELITIPMLGNVASLNVSVATGISLFEANRQRQI